MENSSNKNFFSKRNIIILCVILFIVIGVLVLIYASNKKNQDKTKVLHCNYIIPITTYMMNKIDMYLYIENGLVTKEVSLFNYKFDKDSIDDETLKTMKDELLKAIKTNEPQDGDSHYSTNEGDDYIEFRQEVDISIDSDFNTNFDNRIEEIIMGSKNVGGTCKYE